MSRVLGFAIVCGVIAVVQAVAVALGIALLLVTLFAAVKHPRETVGLLVALGFLVLATARPAACIVALGAVGVIAVVLGGAQRKSLSQLRLTAGREHDCTS